MDQISPEALAAYLFRNELYHCLRTNQFNLVCQIGLRRGGREVIAAVERMLKLPPTGKLRLLKINYLRNYISDRKRWKKLPRLQRLRIVARHGRPKRVRKLIRKFQAEGVRKREWLVEGMKGACEGGHRNLIQLFQQLGHKDDYQPIWHCAFGGHWQLTEDFMQRWGFRRPHFRSTTGINHAMRGACRGGYLEKVREYIARGATEFRYGILTATAEGHLDVIEYLFELLQASRDWYVCEVLTEGLKIAKRVQVPAVTTFYRYHRRRHPHVPNCSCHEFV